MGPTDEKHPGCGDAAGVFFSTIRCLQSRDRRNIRDGWQLRFAGRFARVLFPVARIFRL
jgi:hypothetical protein